MGIAPESLEEHLQELLNYRLIEPFDASAQSISAEQRIAITYSGRMHYELALTDPIYVSQMAFSTPIRSPTVVDRIRSIRDAKMTSDEWAEVRRIFILYCFAQDRMFVRLPKDPMFEGQQLLRKSLRGKWIGRYLAGDIVSSAHMREEGDSQEASSASHATATVKWFDHVKGYGFLDAGLSEDVFIHINTLRDFGLSHLMPNDMVICDVGSGPKGKLQVIAVHSVESTSDPQTSNEALTAANVIFYNPKKGYGFVSVDGVSEDIYLPASVFLRSGVETLSPGEKVSVILGEDVPGRGRAVTFLRV